MNISGSSMSSVTYSEEYANGTALLAGRLGGAGGLGAGTREPAGGGSVGGSSGEPNQMILPVLVVKIMTLLDVLGTKDTTYRVVGTIPSSPRDDGSHPVTRPSGPNRAQPHRPSTATR